MWYMVFHILDGEIYDESRPRLYLPMDYHIWNDECVFRICKQRVADAYCVCVCCSSFDSSVSVADTTANASHIHIDN